MKVIALGRGKGKTTRLLEWLREDVPDDEVRVLVSADCSTAMRLLRENRDLESWRFISIHELSPGVHSAIVGHVVYGIDNVDLVLSHLFPYWHIAAVTITDE